MKKFNIKINKEDIRFKPRLKLKASIAHKTKRKYNRKVNKPKKPELNDE